MATFILPFSERKTLRGRKSPILDSDVPLIIFNSSSAAQMA